MAVTERDSRIVTVPNLISVVRLAVRPGVPLAARRRRAASRPAALLAVLGATDWVDGYIARHFDQGSELGKILDPTADRVLLVAAAVALLDRRAACRVVVGVLVLVREVLVSVAVLVLAAAGRAPHRRAVGRESGHARADVRAARCSSGRRHRTGAGHDVVLVVALGLRDRRPRPRLLRRR